MRAVVGFSFLPFFNPKMVYFYHHTANCVHSSLASTHFQPDVHIEFPLVARKSLSAIW